MAWISVVDDTKPTGTVAELYERMVDPAYGRVDNIMQIHSLHPEGMRTHWELYRDVMTGTQTLPKVDRELIAMVVSVINGCDY